MKIHLTTIDMLEGGQTLMCYVLPAGKTHWLYSVVSYANGTYSTPSIDFDDLGVTHDMIVHSILRQNICAELSMGDYEE